MNRTEPWPVGTPVVATWHLLPRMIGATGKATAAVVVVKKGHLGLALTTGELCSLREWLGEPCQEVAYDDGHLGYVPIRYLRRIDENPDETETTDERTEITA